MKLLAAILLAVTFPALAQSAPPATPDPFKPLAFLEGTWQANGKGAAGVQALGTYTFARELDGHILARHAHTTDCKGPATFDCDHGDLLYLFTEVPGAPLKAIYFDSEGHVLHYDVSVPDATTVIFLSDTTSPGPRFRLTYKLAGSILSGKFQMQPPGQTLWNTYLEWTGPKQ